MAVFLCLSAELAHGAGSGPGEWTGDYPPCARHQEILSRGRMNLGVRFATADRNLAAEFARAMDFWSTVLDMNWHAENTPDCAIAIVDGSPDLFGPTVAARAQFPGSPWFQGWVAFNPRLSLAPGTQYLIAVHEVGHLLGLSHNPSVRSIMSILSLAAPVYLEPADLAPLSALHKLRITELDQLLLVSSRSVAPAALRHAHR